MKALPAITLSVLSLIISSVSLSMAQSKYDPHNAFDPLFDYTSKSMYRSSNGSPGPAYWQNRADYTIDSRLDVETNTITATVRITYTNNSPDRLSYVWLALDQNQLRSDSRGARLSTTPPQFNGGFAIQNVDVIQSGKRSKGLI